MIQNHLSKHPERRSARGAVVEWMHKAEDAADALSKFPSKLERNTDDLDDYNRLYLDRHTEVRLPMQELLRTLDGLEVAALAVGIPWRVVEAYRESMLVTAEERGIDAKISDLMERHDEMLAAYARTALLHRAGNRLLRDALRLPWRSEINQWRRVREVTWLSKAVVLEREGWYPEFDGGRDPFRTDLKDFGLHDRERIRKWKKTWKQRLSTSRAGSSEVAVPSNGPEEQSRS
ncbi:hypothetical protein [Nonomuraea sp. NPDC052265]|uniref:hypothetical protein n=1 Tax=Nonomuraea sp. NPDC052265 TaxID=3364374 RepID=UPI0037C7D1EA